jgi:hypothetical protein
MADVLVPMNWDYFNPGRLQRVDLQPGECVNCGRIGTDFAHGVFEAVAATLAQPLRKAFEDHLAIHRCGRGNTILCDEAKRLRELMPEPIVLIG